MTAHARIDDDLPFGAPASPVVDLDRPLHIGTLSVETRSGPLSVDVEVDIDGSGFRVGAYRLDRRAAPGLLKMARVVAALLSEAPAAAPPIAARSATRCPWEGETLP